MKTQFKAVRGMPDVLPSETHVWVYLENIWKKLMHQFAYQEIRLPIIEECALYHQSVGVESDIIQKEMFLIKGNYAPSTCLRPEGTAGCVRAAIQNHLLRHAQPRLWYMGSMFRRERPQKGRYRQFMQIGVEVFGLSGWEIEFEHLALIKAFWEKLGLSNEIYLEINSLGNLDSRKTYRQALVDYFSQHQSLLDSDSLRRLHSNPLRILDSKNPELQTLIKNAPRLIDYLDIESKLRFNVLRQALDKMKITYKVNHQLVRGLDYCNDLVFEWKSDRLGAQSTLCAGGRFDHLTDALGGEPTPALGFAMGLERIIMLVQALNLSKAKELDVYLIVTCPKAQINQFNLVHQLRASCPNLSFKLGLGTSNLSKALKQANKENARWAFIVGPEEFSQGKVSIKYLPAKKNQMAVNVNSITENFLNEVTP